MIVQCPNCQSKSRVDDAGAARGARVRCATCSHVFLPLTAVVKVAKAPPVPEEASGFGADDAFGGKTSLFTGVVAKAALGLTDDAKPPAAHAPPAAATAAPRPAAKDAAPMRAPAAVATVIPNGATAPAGDADFGGNKTQAIDVSQLAAFSAKMPAPSPAPPSGSLLPGGAPKSKPVAPVAAAMTSGLTAGEPPQRPTTGSGARLGETDIIGTTSRDLGGPLSLASRVVLGLCGLTVVCGLIFFTAARPIYAALGCMGGQRIVINAAPDDAVRIEQVTSVVYTLADGHDALVVLGTVRNDAALPAAKVELAFTLTDAHGTVKARQRAPLGAILSLEELATLTLADSAQDELRRRVQHVPPLAAHGRGQKFMAVVIDPPQPLRAHTQSLAVVPALAAEPAPGAKAGAEAEPAVSGPAAAEVDSDMPAIVQPVAPAHPAAGRPDDADVGHAAPHRAAHRTHKKH